MFIFSLELVCGELWSQPTNHQTTQPTTQTTPTGVASSVPICSCIITASVVPVAVLLRPCLLMCCFMNCVVASLMCVSCLTPRKPLKLVLCGDCCTLNHGCCVTCQSLRGSTLPDLFGLCLSCLVGWSVGRLVGWLAGRGHERILLYCFDLCCLSVALGLRTSSQVMCCVSAAVWVA